jgi:hypothetical protein
MKNRSETPYMVRAVESRSSNPVRLFRDATQVVDVDLEVNKGPQFMFGELHIEGLDPTSQERLAALWKLPGGAPLDQPYMDGFVRPASPMLRGKFRSFSSELHVRPAARVVDVTLRFR